MATSRRTFVKYGSLWIASAAAGVDVGCASRVDPGRAASGRSAPLQPAPMPYGAAPPVNAEPESAPAADTGGCTYTNDNILGPYYRPGAPLRTNLVESGMGGTRLVVRGRVMGQGCKSGLADAVLDVWQADSEGRYDNDGHAPLDPKRYVLRGRLLTDGDGRYEFATIIPGRYLNGGQYRPAHIHVRLAAAGHRPLTTQLYFEGDPYNAVDPFIKPGLTMRPVDERGSKAARFDFVLRAA